MKTIVDEKDRIVRVSVDAEPSERLHHPDRWVQIEIIIVRDNSDASKVKRIRLKHEEFEIIQGYVEGETRT